MAEKNVLLVTAALHESLLGLGGRSQGTNASTARSVRLILAHVRSEDGGSGLSRFQVSNPIVLRVFFPFRYSTFEIFKIL
uniref:Putative secreted protein n=1 Tax=Anopheles darlingi TaxID=43151 RepID=A0A2M4DD16_ANODA